MTPATFPELREAGLKHMREGRYADAEESFRAAHAAATTEADAALAEIHCASVAILQGETSAPVAMLREILIRRHTTLHVFLASYYLTIHLSARRDREAAERYLAILLDAAAELNDPYYLATSWDVASEVALSQGSFDVAYDRALRAQAEIARCAPSEAATMARGVIEHNVGYALLGLGRYGEAIIPLREGIAGLQRSGCGAHSATGYINLALALFIDGETEESEAYLIAAEQGLTGDTQWLAPYVHYLRGEIAQRRGNHAEARMHYERLREYYPDFQNVADILAVVSLLPVLLPERS